MPSKLLASRNSEPLRRAKQAQDKDKRKSEVLIAAKSLDYEIQNVKNLKRLSIGSMDLLLDPELEYTMNNDSPTNEGFTDDKRKSWSQAKFDMIKENENAKKDVSMNSSLSTSGIDIESDEEDSIDVTRAEYLHPEPNITLGKDDKYVGSNLSASSSTSSLNASSNNNDNDNSNIFKDPTTQSKILSSHRKLSGAGFLRRGSNNILRSTRKLSSRPTHSAHSNNNKNHEGDNNNDDESLDGENQELTNQLLWVPASQHPNVKPENYLELVQDTLQHITSEECTHSNDENPSNDKLSSDKDNHAAENDASKRRSLDASLKRHSSVVRRPSMLRSYYTENHNDDSESKEETGTDVDDSKIVPRSASTHKASTNSRSISLKDITEELTKISNSVGLTDNDAITLARTLSMTGSYSENDADESDNISNSNTDKILSNLDSNDSDNENRFASNMFMKNGITIPMRSSLRRSKFNTYKIRGNTQNSSDRSISTSSNISTETIKRRKQLPFIYSDKNNSQKVDHESPLQSPQLTQSNQNNTESPGSITDLYDHYRHSSSDWDIESDTSLQKDTRDEDSDLHTSQESSFNSHESSNDSVLYRPAQGQQLVTERFVDNPNASNNKKDSNDRPWSWIDTESSSEILQKAIEEHHAVEQISDSGDELGAVDDDFVNLKVVTSKKSAEKINHSKNRHMPIFNLNLHSEKKEEEQGPEVIVSAPTKDSTLTVPYNDIVSSSSSDGSQVSNEISREPEKEIVEQSTISIENYKESKKETLEEKFVKLFKRRHHHKNEDSPKVTSSTSQTQEELKKKISKFRSRSHKSSTHTNATKASLIQQVVKHNVTEVKPDSKPDTALTLPRSEVTQTIPEDVTSIPENKDITFEGDDATEHLPALKPAVSVTSSRQTNNMDRSVSTTSNDSDVVETVRELEGDDSQEYSNNDVQLQAQDMPNYVEDSLQASDEDESFVDATANTTIEVLPPRKLTFADVKRPDRPNAPIQFTDSAFGFPLPMLTVSTVIMFDHRLGINVERAIYRLSHLKLSDPKRELRQQVLLSNFMYSYLNLVNHTLYMEQANTANIDNIGAEPAQQTNAVDSNVNGQGVMATIDESSQMSSNSFGNAYTTEHNESNETILIPDIS